MVHFFRHPINTGMYESKICQFGGLIGILFPIWIFIRIYFNKSIIIYKINIIFLILTFILSFIMNINAFIYFIPVFLLELYFYKKKFILQI